MQITDLEADYVSESDDCEAYDPDLDVEETPRSKIKKSSSCRAPSSKRAGSKAAGTTGRGRKPKAKGGIVAAPVRPAARVCCPLRRCIGSLAHWRTTQTKRPWCTPAVAVRLPPQRTSRT